MNTPRQSSLILFMLGLLLGLPRAVSGQVLISGSQSAGPPRRDPGTGLCGQFIQYQRQGTPPMPPRNRQEAVALLDKPLGDPAVLGRIIRRAALVNYRNGQLAAAEGDFTGVMDPDEYFPFSQNQQASPPGTDVDIAVRLRGYLNVTSELMGKTITFALNCDDHCSLRVGGMDVISPFDITVSQRRMRQVRFAEAGLYPVEIVHYQVSGAAFLEWAMSTSAEPECERACTTPFTDASFGGRYVLVPTLRLYNAAIGESPSCQECGAPGQACALGAYCGDGLCQLCGDSDHCGATCTKCPEGARICSFGRCAECAYDDQCSGGKICESGTCIVPFCCGGKYGACPNGLNCNPFRNTCSRLIAETFCHSDAGCPPGWICYSGQCRQQEPRCSTDLDCLAAERCDPVRKVCETLPAESQASGCSGQPGSGSDSGCGPIDVPVPDGPVCLSGDTIVPLQVMRVERPCDGCRMDRGSGTTRAAPVGLLALCLFSLLARRIRTPLRIKRAGGRADRTSV